VLGPPLRSIHVVLCPPFLDVGADPLDVLVPRPLQVVPPDRQLALLCVGRCAELVGLFLSRRARVLDVALEVGPGLSLCVVPRRVGSSLSPFLQALRAETERVAVRQVSRDCMLGDADVHEWVRRRPRVMTDRHVHGH
jgi:hypothetical protein